MRKYYHSFFFIALTTGLASSISLIGGIGLETISEKILPLVPLLVALPSLNTMVGDYAAIIAAHAGDPGEQKNTKTKLAKAISKSIFVNIVGVSVLSIVVAARRGYVFENGFMIKFILFVPISMISIITFMFALTTLLDKLLESRRFNSDDILIPIVTSITDVMMLGLITLAVFTIF